MDNHSVTRAGPRAGPPTPSLACPGSGPTVAAAAAAEAENEVLRLGLVRLVPERGRPPMLSGTGKPAAPMFGWADWAVLGRQGGGTCLWRLTNEWIAFRSLHAI